MNLWKKKKGASIRVYTRIPAGDEFGGQFSEQFYRAIVNMSVA